MLKALKSIAGLNRLKSRGLTTTAWIGVKLMLTELAQRLAPSFSREEERHPESPYGERVRSRLRIGLIAVTCAVLGGPVCALLADNKHLRRLRNAPRRRLQQRPAIPINPTGGQPSLD